MQRRAFCSSVLAATLAACAAPRPAGRPLAGRWMPVDATLGGRPFPLVTLLGATLYLTEDSYEFAGDKGSYAVVSTARPAKLDIHGREGRHAGRTIPAIFALDGDQLTVCYQLEGNVRPPDFTSPTGSRVLLVRYKRVR